MKKYYFKQFIIILVVLFLATISYYFLKDTTKNVKFIFLIVIVGLTLVGVVLDKILKVNLNQYEKFKIAKLDLLIGPLTIMVVFILYNVIFNDYSSLFNLDFAFTTFAVMIGVFIGALIRLGIEKRRFENMI